ncbi:MAG: hypothetical protein SGJ26_11465 [Nitrospirota bacterium]|nr:hypothetical protein [Nitrospirota bacterium]
MDGSSIPKPRGIAAVGLSQEEEQKIFDVLFALGSQGKMQWRYTDIKYAAALIADTTVQEGRAAAEQFMLVPERVLIVVGNDVADLSHGRFALARPLTEQAIGQSLHDATGYFSLPGAIPSPLTVAASVQAAKQAPGNDRLVDLLHNVMEEDGGLPAFIFTGTGLPRLVLSPKAKKVLSDKPWEDLKSFDFSTSVEVQGVSVGDPILPRLILDGLPLHYLLWPTGLYSGHGQLLPYLDAAKTYKLSRWPEFGTIDFTPQFLKVMSYLSKHAATLSDVTAWSGIAREDVADLMNAAGLCSYLASAPSDDLARGPIVPTEAVQEKRGLFNRIRNKLGMLQTG